MAVATDVQAPSAADGKITNEHCPHNSLNLLSFDVHEAFIHEMLGEDSITLSVCFPERLVIASRACDVEQ